MKNVPESASSAAPTDPPRARLVTDQRGAALALAAGLLVEAGVLFAYARRFWFWRDDWTFLLDREGLWGLLWAPYSGHWSTLPQLWFRTAFHLFGLHHYLPYAMASITAHIAIAVLWYLLLRRWSVSPWIAALSTLAITFLAGGIGAQNPTWAFQVGFLGSCVFGLLALLAVGGGRRSQSAGVVALVLGLMCSGVGLIMLALVGAWLLLSRGWRSALAILAVPVVVYLTWYALSGHTASIAPTSLRTAFLQAVLGIDWIGRSVTAVPGTGAVVVAALAYGVFAARHRAPIFIGGVSGLIALAAGYALFAAGRSGLSNHATQQPRYAYVGIILCAPALACLLTALTDRLGSSSRLQTERWTSPVSWVPPVSWVLVAVLAAWLGLSQTVSYADWRLRDSDGLRQRVLATAQLLRSHERILNNNIWPNPLENRGLLVSSLRDPTNLAALPRRSPSPYWLLEQRLQLQVTVSDHPLPVPRIHRVTWDRFAAPARHTRSGGACSTRVTPSGGSIAVPLREHGGQVRVRITPSGDHVPTLRLVDGAHQSSLMLLPDAVGRSVYVGGTAPGVTLRIWTPPGTAEVCTG